MTAALATALATAKRVAVLPEAGRRPLLPALRDEARAARPGLAGGIEADDWPALRFLCVLLAHAGLVGEAAPLLRLVFDSRSPIVRAQSRNLLAVLLVSTGSGTPAEAAVLLREASVPARDLPIGAIVAANLELVSPARDEPARTGVAHVDALLAARAALGRGAVRSALGSLRAAAAGTAGDPPDPALDLGALAHLQQVAADLANSAGYRRHARDVLEGLSQLLGAVAGRDDRRVLLARANLATAGLREAVQAGEPSFIHRARRAAQQVYDEIADCLGERSDLCLAVATNIGVARVEESRLTGSVGQLRSAVEFLRTVAGTAVSSLGPAHPHTAAATAALATAEFDLACQERSRTGLTGAETLLERAVRASAGALGAGHAATRALTDQLNLCRDVLGGLPSGAGGSGGLRVLPRTSAGDAGWNVRYGPEPGSGQRPRPPREPGASARPAEPPAAGAGSTATLMRATLARVAPGTALRDGLERILYGRTGALIVLGHDDVIERICAGGFPLDVEFSATFLRELCKMDGAVVLSGDGSRIVRAAVHLMPDPAIPSEESGTRHRTAERVAKQSGLPVIAVSRSMRTITVYVDSRRHVLDDSSAILSRANQALATLERYKLRLDEVSGTLSALEVEDLVTVRDAVAVVQRHEMVRRIADEIAGYVVELGTDGRLLRLHLEELVSGVDAEQDLVIRDYLPAGRELRTPQEARARLARLAAPELISLGAVAAAMGHGGAPDALDGAVSPRGYRLLAKLPRLPAPLVERLVARFGSLPRLLAATVEDLQVVAGMDPARARGVREDLSRLAQP